LQTWWAATLFGAFKLIFGVRVVVEGDDVTVPGPILLFVRHASIADTLLPNVVLTRRHGLRLRYVMKRELLNDPAIDVAGNRLVNYFVQRGSADAAGEIARVRGLTSGLGDHEGVLIYPEGTRFTESKRRRVLESLQRRDPRLAEKAARFRYVLPPRLGGPMALLDPLTPCDVVFAAHVGFDGLATVKDLWEGTIVGTTVRIGFWRVPGSEIPARREERIDWLFDRWAEVDAWIERARG
jgi:1-acyl-sn-glycerol-3-phosphate acyltransferase